MPETLNNKQQRKPRYRRAPDANVRLQERDKEIIKLVHKYRFLSSVHLAALLPGSSQGLLRRLHLLFHSGYLNRPPEQIRPYRQGSDPMVYGLGNKGADLLAAEYGFSRGKVDWTSKNREVKKVYLEHTLMVTNFMVCLEVACKQRGDIEIIESEEIIAKMPQKPKATNPLSWKVKIKQDGYGEKKEIVFSMVPDKVFGLYFKKDPPGQNRAYFLLEADRSTMPVKRDSLFKSSYYKKLVGYWASWKDNLYQGHFGFKSARVLTLTKSEERIKNMIAVNKGVDDRGQGSKMFLFARADDFTLDHPEKILDRSWKDGKDAAWSSLRD